MRFLMATLIVALCGSPAMAEIRERSVRYKDGDVELEGYFAWDDAVSGQRPGVLVIHEWWGLNDYARSRARQLAGLGYVAFAADMYGRGKSTTDPKEAGAWAGAIRADVPRLRARAALGLAELKRSEFCDPRRVAAIGYCFGGGAALELAYSGADLRGIVSFHGSLPTPTAEEARAIKARILICHGAADPAVSEESAHKLRDALSAAERDWMMIYYSNARHAFTNPAADGKFSQAVLYNAEADRRSWAHMRLFFDEIFAPRK